MTMPAATARWPRGTGQWSRTRVLIVTADPPLRDRLIEQWSEQHDVVAAITPLDVIDRLERDGQAVSTVVMDDVAGSVTKSELVDFLEDFYPWIRLMFVTSAAVHDHDAHGIYA